MKNFSAEVGTAAMTQLNDTIEFALAKHKDLTPFMKGAIKRSIGAEVERQLTADQQHMGAMGRLWKASKGTPSDKARIIDTYLARAKQVLTTAKNKALTEAGFSTTVSKQQQGEERRREPTTGGRPGSSAPRQYSAKEIDWSKTSDEDILADKPTLRKRK